jgi:hypothetical protein
MNVDTNAAKLLAIIEMVDTFIAQLRIDGYNELAERVSDSLEELYWVYKELTAYE